MNKFIHKLLFYVSILLAALLPMIASAEGKSAFIDVEFESGAAPLFQGTDLAPGDTVTRWVKVTNLDDNKSYPISAKTLNESDGGLGSQMNLAVSLEDAPLYSGTFADFFAKDEISLGTLAPLAVAQYYFAASFNAEADNDYQDKQMSFDLALGISGTDDYIDDGGGNGGGGGGGGFNPCGNGTVNPGEQCDTGSLNGVCPSACSTLCVLNTCGSVQGTSTPGLEYLPEPAKPERPLGLISGAARTIKRIFQDNQPVQGEILGAATNVPGPAQAEAVSCTALWWWWLGYLAYAVLLFLAYWQGRKYKKWWVYVLPIILCLGVVLWWWYEPCPAHLWQWLAAVAVYFLGLTIWHMASRRGGKREVPAGPPLNP